MALSGDFDLVLLDLMLPTRNGLQVLEEIRAQRPQLPVILVSALGQNGDVVDGLDRGADDYITKPFDLDELLARVRAQLRRPAQRDPTRLEVGDLEMDLRTREVVRRGHAVHLTAREFELLAYLMRHPNQVLSREQILSAVWGYDFDPGTNVLSVYINYLRRKLTVDDDPPPIETIRAAGFKLAVPVARALRLGGLRVRLVVAIMIVAAAVLVGSFLALHRVSGSELRAEIDDHLRADLGEFESFRRGELAYPRAAATTSPGVRARPELPPRLADLRDQHRRPGDRQQPAHARLPRTGRDRRVERGLRRPRGRHRPPRCAPRPLDRGLGRRPGPGAERADRLARSGPSGWASPWSRWTSPRAASPTPC